MQLFSQLHVGILMSQFMFNEQSFIHMQQKVIHNDGNVNSFSYNPVFTAETGKHLRILYAAYFALKFNLGRVIK